MDNLYLMQNVATKYASEVFAHHFPINSPFSAPWKISYFLQIPPAAPAVRSANAAWSAQKTIVRWAEGPKAWGAHWDDVEMDFCSPPKNGWIYQQLLVTSEKSVDLTWFKGQTFWFRQRWKCEFGTAETMIYKANECWFRSPIMVFQPTKCHWFCHGMKKSSRWDHPNGGFKREDQRTKWWALNPAMSSCQRNRRLPGMFLDLNVGVMFLENDGMFVKKHNTGGCSYVVSTQLYVRMGDQRPTKWGDMLRKSKTPRESANFSRDLATNTWSWWLQTKDLAKLGGPIVMPPHFCRNHPHVLALPSRRGRVKMTCWKDLSRHQPVSSSSAMRPAVVVWVEAKVLDHLDLKKSWATQNRWPILDYQDDEVPKPLGT